jgi:4-aminobutyrate aminotransferase-like enzyme
METNMRVIMCPPDFVQNIRGMGVMWGIEVVTSGARDRLIQIGEEMVNETGYGLLLLGAGNVHNPNNAIRIMPPLTITEQELDLAFDLLEKIFAKARKEIVINAL